MFESIKALNLNIALEADKAKFDELQPQLLEIRKQGDELDAAFDATLDKVIHAFVSAVALAGPAAEGSQKKLEAQYKNRFSSLDGLPDMIAKRKAELK